METKEKSITNNFNDFFENVAKKYVEKDCALEGIPAAIKHLFNIGVSAEDIVLRFGFDIEDVDDENPMLYLYYFDKANITSSDYNLLSAYGLTAVGVIDNFFVVAGLIKEIKKFSTDYLGYSLVREYLSNAKTDSNFSYFLSNAKTDSNFSYLKKKNGLFPNADIDFPYTVEIWSSESERDYGLGEIDIQTFDLDTAINRAKKIYYERDLACAEVIDNTTEKTVYHIHAERHDVEEFGE